MHGRREGGHLTSLHSPYHKIQLWWHAVRIPEDQSYDYTQVVSVWVTACVSSYKCKAARRWVLNVAGNLDVQDVISKMHRSAEVFSF